MRLLHIFLIHSQNVFEKRGRVFVYFLTTLLNPLILILYWRGAAGSSKAIVHGWDFPTIASYYFFLTIAASLLMVSLEDSVAEKDIHQGNLIAYLLKPFSYFWRKFFEELPYRLVKGAYALMVCIIFFLIFGEKIFVIHNSLQGFFLSLIIALLALFLTFLLKMTVALLAFWLIDIGTIFEALDVILLIFAGYALPLALMPSFLTSIASVLPFAYMIYFPVIAFQGKLLFFELIRVIVIQSIWIIVFIILYHFIWQRGIKKFTGVGQ